MCQNCATKVNEGMRGGGAGWLDTVDVKVVTSWEARLVDRHYFVVVQAWSRPPIRCRVFAVTRYDYSTGASLASNYGLQ